MALKTVRMAGHEEQLSVVDHLEELRRRLFVCLGALVLAFGLCLWQSHLILRVINEPLAKQTRSQVAAGRGPEGQAALTEQAVRKLAAQTDALATLLATRRSRLPAAVRARLGADAKLLAGAATKLPRSAEGDKPYTLSIGEPFTSTLTVALYFALLLAAPVILFELYGFILPAFDPRERRLVMPLLYALPILFICGLLFAYFIVLPTAVSFLQNFNSGEFNVIVQASQYYEFAAMTMLAVALSFELPVAVVGAVAAGVVSTARLRKFRRYAFLICAAIAALLPGEAITMVIETIPLYALYELSILAARLAERRRTAALAATEAAGA
jgi:sec-independent protein translocase protein TatC